MKNKKLYFLGITILLIVFQTGLQSCPRCSQDFYSELLGKRANTLAGKELLEAIRNQSIPGQPSSFNLPSSIDSVYDSEETDTQNAPGGSELYGKDKYDSMSMSSGFQRYISVIERLVFFGNILN